MRYARIIALAAAGAFSAWSSAAGAVTLDFFCITSGSAAAVDCGIGETQMSVDVMDIGSGQVQFDFFNTGASQSTISEVYFDDGTLLGLASLIDMDDGVGGDMNVDFSPGGSPPDLPGGNSITPAFNVTAGFLADADNPAPKWGVSPGESLGIIFDLQAGTAFADVITDLTTGDLRIGLHVINFADGGSVSLVNNPVPVPAAVWLFGSGLLALAGASRRRKRSTTT